MSIRELPPTAGLPLKWSDFFAGSTETLEQKLSRFLGVPSVQIESSGTACLIIALTALAKISGRKTVVIPGYTCPLVVIAIAQAGLKTRICDTRPDSFDFDIAALQSACDDDTLCIIPTHMGGLPADMAPVREIATASGARIIEDAAQSLGATDAGKNVGTESDAAFFSLSVGKGLTIYQGGVLSTADESLRKLFEQTSRELVRNNSLAEIQKLVETAGYCMAYNPVGLNFAYGQNLRSKLATGDEAAAVGDVFDIKQELYPVSNLRKQIGAAAFDRLPQMLTDNRTRALERVKRLSQIEELTVLTERPNTTGSWPFISIICRSEETSRQILQRLWTSGLGVTKLFAHSIPEYKYLSPLLPPQPAPNAASLARRCFTISNSPMVTDEYFERILDTLQAAIERGRN